jgi:2-polyprenyl-6-methoxyphenol hydroxylase-like FAD-dependent oxidoreductase
MAGVAKRLGSSSVTLHRGALLTALYDGFGVDNINVGKRFVHYEQDARCVTAHFDDGSTASGDLLVATDGVHSTVRTQMFGPQPTRYCGYVCYRGVTAEAFDHPDLPRGRLIEIWGRGVRMGTSHIAEGRVHWWLAENLPDGALPDQVQWKARLLSLTRAWAPPGPQILHATDAAAFLCNYIHDRVPDHRWTDGRVVLLGDAAHPMAPDLGQGANQAIEDAMSLATSLDTASSVHDGLNRYERLRRPRTAKIQQMSRQFGLMGQWTLPLACNLRAASMWLMPHALWVRQFETLMRVDL